MSDELKIARIQTDIKWIKWALGGLVAFQIAQFGAVAMAAHP